MLSDPELFIIDSGATGHGVGDRRGMRGLREVSNVETLVGDGSFMKSNLVGDLPVAIINDDGDELHRAVLKDVVYDERMPFNVIASNLLVACGFYDVRIQGHRSRVSQRRYQVGFVTSRSRTDKGVLYCVRLKRTEPHVKFASDVLFVSGRNQSTLAARGPREVRPL